MATAESNPSLDFLRQHVTDDLAQGRFNRIVTRFPPEPNGYLHIGHAKAMLLSYNIATENNTSGGGEFHLRFDDTNPVKEEQHYIDAIKQDVRWLGVDWGEHEYYASNYFDQLYAWAELLVEAGKAYVDDQSADEVRASRGTLTTPGTESPCRDRPADESLDLLRRMKAGEFPDGSKVLRARIDMASPNLNLRDPVMYRILHATHHRTGDKWCIYPMYDWAHGQSDWIEGITHSLCSLEFEDHRPLYDWFLDQLIEAGATSPAGEASGGRPRQIEFARFNLTRTVMSKRKLLQLVQDEHLDGWDDPRMPTLAAMRRRGYPPEAIHQFCRETGVSKRPQTIELSRLEHDVRDVLNRNANRVMGVLDPLKVTITNYESGEELLDAVNNPEDASAGTRQVPFSGELYIEKSDFMEDPPRKFKRLSPGVEVRLRYAYFLTCNEVVKDEAGEVVELRCTYDLATKGGDSADGRKPKGTIHWVSAPHALEAEVRQYDHLFLADDPEAEAGEDLGAKLNPESLTVLTGCKVEPGCAKLAPGDPQSTVQFERHGYFCLDLHHGKQGTLVFNRTVTLKDTWARMQKAGKAG